MPAKKIQNVSAPSNEQMQACISMLRALLPSFKELQQKAEIEQPELESLTNRFASTVIDMYGHNTQPSQRYEGWRPYSLSSYNQRDSRQKRHQQIQEDRRDGLTRTFIELVNVIEQLELKLQHAFINKSRRSHFT